MVENKLSQGIRLILIILIGVIMILLLIALYYFGNQYYSPYYIQYCNNISSNNCIFLK